ncbi:MAG TPA: hypothetical protein VJA18_07315 [Candidatus Nanoarchaeia archaeon]|nr:hypothetical protein [Candidatus Nanoarchaeia archaeon]
MKKRVKHSKVKSKKRMPSKKVKNGSTLKATELLREVINLIAVYKKEAKRDVTTRIDPDTADELLEKLQLLAKAL